MGIQEAIVISSPLPNPSSHKIITLQAMISLINGKYGLQLTNQRG